MKSYLVINIIYVVFINKLINSFTSSYNYLLYLNVIKNKYIPIYNNINNSKINNNYKYINQFTIPKILNNTKYINYESENFKINNNNNNNFSSIGGYNLIKNELMQCADILVNYTKYQKYNVRTPKGVIFEGPPGNGKTLLAKCFSGEINVNFIPVSGAQFQEKYVGIGASRVRELFNLASKNKPCIIFIDEIDAIGRKRSTNDKNSDSERDSTLNELLVCLDGFISSDGIFIIGATNRADLLDPALIRPGRIDKHIYIGYPDKQTRKSIITIHITGKPYDNTISIDKLIDMTQGLSGAQIENLLNEAMLNALRNNRDIILNSDIDYILTRILIGWQSSQINYTNNNLYKIAIHEMGHAIVGYSIKNYNKLLKVTLNLWSHKTPGYTLFETKDTEDILTKEHLINRIMVLLGGRIAEEVFFNNSISTGALKDIEDIKHIVNSMIFELGMGKKIIYPSLCDKSKEDIDKEINKLIKTTYYKTKKIILKYKNLIYQCANILLIEHIITPDTIEEQINKMKMKIKNKKKY